METRAFYAELLPRLESIELAGRPEWTATTFVGGLKHLPIRYTLKGLPVTRSARSTRPKPTPPAEWP